MLTKEMLDAIETVCDYIANQDDEWDDLIRHIKEHGNADNHILKNVHTVGAALLGWERLADCFSNGIKTLLPEKELNYTPPPPYQGQYYVIVSHGNIDLETHGPFDTPEQRSKAANELWAEHSIHTDSIYWANVEDGKLATGTYWEDDDGEIHAMTDCPCEEGE